MRMLAIVAIVACGKDSPAAPDDHEAALLATAHAQPRADWPCTRDVAYGDGHLTKDAFTYGTVAACRYAISLQTEGIVGCPDHITRTNADGTTATITFEYRGDHLVNGTRPVQWRADDTAYDEAGPHFARTSAGVQQTPPGASVDYTISDNKLLKLVSTAVGVTTTNDLVWQGTRLVSIVGTNGTASWTATFGYCP